MPLTYGGASLAPRAGVALVLAVLIHLSAWQTLAGIRVLLPRREPPPRSPPGHAAVQVVLPKSARLVYASYGTVRVGGFMLGVRGRTTTRWRFQNGHYQSDLSIDVVNFVESSQGLFDPDFGLEPERYSETRPRRPVSTTQFDWANRRVSFTE